MKRIVGRKMVSNQIDDYPKLKVTPLDPNLVSEAMVNFRFKWASDLIDNLKKEGSICYHLLDVGTHDGLMSLIAAKKHTDQTETIFVDAIEGHKESFEAAETMAKQLRDRGLHLSVHNVLFENYKTDTVYDMIIAFEILEHTKDPMFCIEKMYELLEIGGHLMITVPEEHGHFGLTDKNPFHYWTSTIQSLVFMFHDESKWKIKQVFEVDGLIHMILQKKTYQQ